MKAIVFDMGLDRGVIAQGETDGKIVDIYYIKVAGELYHSSCVLQDTSEARCAVELVVKANTAAKNALTMSNLMGCRLLSKFKLP